MEKLNCLICENPVAMPDPNIDLDNYDGQVFCHECDLLLYIKTIRGKVLKYKVVPNQTIKVDKEIKVITAVPRPDYSKK